MSGDKIEFKVKRKFSLECKVTVLLKKILDVSISFRKSSCMLSYIFLDFHFLYMDRELNTQITYCFLLPRE